jgi:hypothetical protein
MAEANTTESEQVVRDFVAWENGDESKRRVVSESLDMYNPGLLDGEAPAERRSPRTSTKVDLRFSTSSSRSRNSSPTTTWYWQS